jgi:thymidylate kinase
MTDNIIDFFSYKKKNTSTMASTQNPKAVVLPANAKGDKVLNLEAEQAEQLKRAAARNESNRERLKRERERANSNVMKSYRLK